MANTQPAESVPAPASDNTSSASVIFGGAVEQKITVQKT